MDKDYRERIREEAGRETVPRRMFIRKEDVEEHGYIVRCPGCDVYRYCGGRRGRRTRKFVGENWKRNLGGRIGRSRRGRRWTTM